MRAAVVAVLASACGGSEPAPLPAWNRELPSASVLGDFGGLTPARGIIHLHSPYSHDACDGMPRPGGVPNEPCLQSLRAALCTTRIDYAALTDHDDSMADEEFLSLFHTRPGDAPVLDGSGAQIASRITCDNGHEVLLTVGGENDLMPIMLNRHVSGTVDERHATYNGTDATSITSMRDAGALIWIPHTESRTLAHLTDVMPNGLEAYNLHANLDPDIREEFLGLDRLGAVSGALEFADTNEGGPEPDLALLAFLAPNEPALARWDELLAMGRKVAASAGSDAHENALPIILADGERGDSYRRVFRWFSNIALVADPRDPVQVEAAIAAGRMFSVFEVMGTPDGFSMSVTPGDTVAIGTTLTIGVPRVRDLDASMPAPTVTTTVVRVDGNGRTELAGPEVVLDRPGAYRVVVAITPRHLGPYLRALGPSLADTERPWIYTSPIYVE